MWLAVKLCLSHTSLETSRPGKAKMVPQIRSGGVFGVIYETGKFRSAGFRLGLSGVILALLLSGCGGGSGGGPSAGITSTAPAPVQLGGAPASAGGVQASFLGPLDEALVRRTIENYRISKKRDKGPYQLAGADLNGDGVREAVVLFQGKDWCTRTGCSMAIFQSFNHGFRVISRTVRVKPPVEITGTMTNAYRDILVQTGGGPAPERRVRLQFSGEGYSRNAMLQPEVPLGSAVSTQIAIDVPPVSATSTARR
jgi:hypothetical protein